MAKELRFRPKEAIVDGSGLESRAVSKETAYSGKNHDVCTKLLLEVTPDYLPLHFQFGRGNEHDIEEWKRYVKRGGKLPYKVWQEKGYESGKLRKELRKLNCQVKIEPKKYTKSHKRGPAYKWTKEDGNMRR